MERSDREKIKAVNSSIGSTYRAFRKEKHYTQEVAAEKSNVTVEYLCKFEKGIYNAKANTIIDLCKSVDITPTMLFHDFFEDTGHGISDIVVRELNNLSIGEQHLVLDYVQSLKKQK